MYSCYTDWNIIQYDTIENNRLICTVNTIDDWNENPHLNGKILRKFDLSFFT